MKNQKPEEEEGGRENLERKGRLFLTAEREPAKERRGRVTAGFNEIEKQKGSQEFLEEMKEK